MPEQGPYDDLVARLHALRAEAGLPSFGDIASRVSRVRRERGLTVEGARVGRTTVYDAFRLGRQRIDADLIGDIVRALGVENEAASAWVEDARRARRAAVVLPATPPEAPAATLVPAPTPTAPAPAPALVSAGPARTLAPTWMVTVLLACLAANLLGRLVVDALGLPVYLDMVGTAFSAILLGPWWGALVGATTNVAGVAGSGPDSLLFVPVNVVGALAWGYGVRRFAMGRSIPRFFLFNVGVALLCSAVAVPIVVVLEGGYADHGTALITRSALTMIKSLWAAVIVSNLLTSVADKLICGFVSLAVLESLPSGVRPAGWMRAHEHPAPAAREGSGSLASS